MVNNRALDSDEIRRLQASTEIAKRDRELSKAASRAWPTAYNLRLLAEAVSKRREFVTFDNNVRFRIKYYSRIESVFIKPAEKGFVPCGYFGFKRLKEVLNTEADNE